MTKPTTHVLMITDMSGSMDPLADDVRGGFNAYVNDLRHTGGRYRLTVTLFDDQFVSLCSAAELQDVPVLDATNYRPRAMTALLDAVGRTVTVFEADTQLGDDDRVLVVVQTDGADNASQEFTRDQVAELIRAREATGKWSFIYLGAGPDAWSQAGRMGFAASNTIRTEATAGATRSSYSGLTAASAAYSRGASGAEATQIVSIILDDDADPAGDRS